MFYLKFMLIVFLLSFSFPLLAGESEKFDLKVVEVEKVSVSDIAQRIRLIGTIKSKHSTLLLAKINGILDYVAHPGEKILEGGLIASLDNIDLENKYDLAVESERLAKAQYDRLLKLSDSNAVSQATLDEKKREWIDATQALSNTKIELDKTKFLAPFDGVVGAYKIYEGAQVQAGNKIVHFYDPDDLLAEFAIPGQLIQYLDVHSKVIINNTKVTLSYFQKMLDPLTHMAPAYVNFDCKSCIIGNSINVHLIVREKNNVLTIPYEAVFIRNQKRNVFVVNNEKLEMKAVTLGIREKNQVEVVSGISEGDQVVVRGQQRLFDGQQVKIYQEKTK